MKKPGTVICWLLAIAMLPVVAFAQSQKNQRENLSQFQTLLTKLWTYYSVINGTIILCATALYALRNSTKNVCTNSLLSRIQ